MKKYKFSLLKRDVLYNQTMFKNVIKVLHYLWWSTVQVLSNSVRKYIFNWKSPYIIVGERCTVSVYHTYLMEMRLDVNNQVTIFYFNFIYQIGEGIEMRKLYGKCLYTLLTFSAILPNCVFRKKKLCIRYTLLNMYNNSLDKHPDR